MSSAEVIDRYLADHGPELVHPEARFHDRATGDEAVGPDAIAEKLYTWYHVAFPGARVTEVARAVGHDHVVLQLLFEGVNDGPFEGRPATGHAVSLPLCAAYRLRDGRIVRIDLYYDQLTLYRQLGGGRQCSSGPEARFLADPGPGHASGPFEQCDGSAERVVSRTQPAQATQGKGPLMR